MSDGVRERAARAWAFRARVEHEAAARFDRLSFALESLDPASPLIAMLSAAAEDERVHEQLCANLARDLGAVLPAAWPVDAPVAPPALRPRAAVLYEVVAASCITETESLGTLTELLPSTTGEVEQVLRHIARDEVRHAQLGWAHLARERATQDVAFLAGAVPVMLAGTVDEALWRAPADPLDDAAGLLAFGVLPHTSKREVFVRALREVVFPGLEHLGVDSGPAWQWLAARAGANEDRRGELSPIP